MAMLIDDLGCGMMGCDRVLGCGVCAILPWLRRGSFLVPAGFRCCRILTCEGQASMGGVRVSGEWYM